MPDKIWNIYLSGEIHSNWREEITSGVNNFQLPVNIEKPVTNHSDSDDCGANILGPESNSFWHDYKGASINSIRTHQMIKASDIVVVRFGEKYRQWNAAFDAGLAIALGKPLITLHSANLNHALKEIDAAANAVCESPDQIVSILRYVINGDLPKTKNAYVAE
tara:strand:- start:1119 stop:1607 length:489 start_codon:yes stop_codon:yes gene_type:complete